MVDRPFCCCFNRLSFFLLLLAGSRSQAFVAQQAPPFRKQRSFTTTSLAAAAPPELYIVDDDEAAAEAPLWAVERIDRVTDYSPKTSSSYPNPLLSKPNVPLEWFVNDNEAVAARVEVDSNATILSTPAASVKRTAAAFTLAGPRSNIAFDPTSIRAAVVTCGGLCPGLNTVIREIVLCLKRQYGVNQAIFGIKGGYRGFLDPSQWLLMNERTVNHIHQQGGSILGTSRGGHDTVQIVDSLEEMNIDQVYVIGGDGTVRGATKIAEELQKRQLPTTVAVVPKTIDNDVPFVDRTFGFQTAVEEARRAIDAAHVEAEGFPFGVAVVRLMGRNSGFISMYATLGTRHVDLCLVPEVSFYLDGPGGIVDHLYERLLENDKAVVVVAEGAAQDLMETEEIERGTDLSGNVLLNDVGPWLCAQLKSRLNEKLAEDGNEVTLKYIDPSYMVRGLASNAADNIYCTQLAHNAVHGSMAGLTAFLVGPVNTRFCYLPLKLVADKRNVIDAGHRSVWTNVVFDTGQPAFAVDPDVCDLSDLDITTASGGCVLASR